MRKTECECGHLFIDHKLSDIGFLCLGCNCDEYRKAASEETTDLPAGVTPEGLAMEKVEPQKEPVND